MNQQELEKINEEILAINSELERVTASLMDARAKESKNKILKEEALMFIDKTEKLISLAEVGKIKISSEQKQKISKTLSHIMKIFR
jgi:hypothetical protein